MTDTVEKVFWGSGTKFSRAADAFRAQRCEGPRGISEKRPQTFASALRRVPTAAVSKNQQLRDFWRRTIFDFFNTIGQQATSGRDLVKRLRRPYGHETIRPVREAIFLTGEKKLKPTPDNNAC